MTTHPPIPSSTRPRQSPWQPVWEIVRFELQESFRTRFVFLAFGFFFLISLLVIHVNGTDWTIAHLLRQALNTATGPGELVPYANSPLAIMQTVNFVAGIPLAIVVAGVFADRATKDFSNNMDGLLFTSPLKEWQFLAGRLLASFLISLIIFLGLGLGLLVGSALPWMSAERIAPFNPLNYVLPYLLIVIPNILIFGLFSFALGLLTRRTLPSYLAIVGLSFAYFIIASIFDVLKLDPLFKFLANPFGSGAVDYAVRFWTRVDKNTLLVPFDPAIWLSRLLWLGVSLAFFIWVWRRFSFAGMAIAHPNPRLERWLNRAEQRLMFWKSHASGDDAARSHSTPEANSPKIGELAQPAPTAHLHYGTTAQARHVWRIAQLDLNRLIGNPLVLAIFGTSIIGMMILIGSSIQDGLGVPAVPVIGTIVRWAGMVLGFLAPLLIVFLAGDLVWRDREVRIDALSDPLPVRSWALVLGKLLALALILALTLVLVMIGGIVAQTVNQYTNYELGVYAIGLFTLTLVDLLLISVLAITIQVLVNQKFLGYFLSAAIVIVLAQGSSLFKPVRLLQFGYRPDAFYSQISGYGRMLEPVRWFQFYWLAIAILLLCVATLFWVRGVETQPKQRWRIARQRFTRPMQMVMSLSAIAALCLGGWIFYNTQILTPSLSRDQANAQFIAYEKAYGGLIDAQPKVTAINLQGDMYPEEDSRFAVRGTYTLENKTQKPIDTLLINVHTNTQVNQVTVNGTPGKLGSPFPGYQAYEVALPAPLKPGATVEATFDLLLKPPAGFDGEKPSHISRFVANGANIRSVEFLPVVGFIDRPRITSPQAREQAGLAKLDPAVEAKRALQSVVPGIDRVQYSATLSTAADQRAFTSGELAREWTEGERRYFEYKTQEPIIFEIPFITGKYDVLRDQWNDVSVEVYYHPGHDRNVERMQRGAQQALDYASQNFSPYPHKTLRIVETPYATEAISHPTTIYMGESFGFQSKMNDNDSSIVDQVLRVTAHETAHQWWGQQLSPAFFVPGSKILTESLAEYTAYQVLGKAYGLEQVGLALRNNLDIYLQKRSTSDVPLVRAGLNDTHLVYSKGSLAMYALQDYLGEDVVNQILAKFLQDYRNVPPYPTGRDLVNALREQTPAKYQYLITDLFETVTLYNNRAESVTVEQRPDGKFDVTLKVNAAKVRSDNNGNETPAEMNNEEIDVGVYDAAGKLIYLQKHPFSNGQSELTITVDQRPQTAGIDPLNKLIDKVPDDNVMNAKESQ